MGLAGSTFYFYTQSQNWKEDHQNLQSEYNILQEKYDFLDSLISENVIERTTNIVAVSEDGQGVLATLTVDLTPGTGDIFVKSGPLIGFDFQDAQIDAVRAAANFTNFSIEEDSNGLVDIHTHFEVSAETTKGVTIPRIDGPSVGAAATIATIAALRGKNIRNGVVITGTISPDGEIGPVDGVKEKAEAAEAANMELFLVPEGQSVSTPGDLEIREVSNLNEATDYFYE